MKPVRYLFCKHCHNLVQVIHDAGVPIVCCGEPMVELIPNSTDAAEKSMCRSCSAMEIGFMWTWAQPHIPWQRSITSPGSLW